MKQIIAILIILLMASQASAGSNWNPLEVGKEMIAGGIDKAIINMADGLMDFVCGPEEETGNETIDGAGHDSVTTKIIAFASWSVKPFQYPTIVQMMGVSLACAIGFLMIYIFVGAAHVSLSSATPGTYRTSKYIMGAGNGNDGLSNYGQNVIMGVLSMSFIILLIFVAMLFAETLKEMIMGSIANSISPSMESVSVLYLAMAIMWVCVGIFFGISNLVICLTAGFSFVLGALYASDRTRHISVWWMDYFISMVIMQVLVVAIAAIMVGVMMDIKTGEYGHMITPGMESSMYIALILFLVGMCAVFVLGKVLLIKIAKTVIKAVA